MLNVKEWISIGEILGFMIPGPRSYFGAVRSGIYHILLYKWLSAINIGLFMDGNSVQLSKYTPIG